MYRPLNWIWFKYRKREILHLQEIQGEKNAAKTDEVSSSCLVLLLIIKATGKLQSCEERDWQKVVAKDIEASLPAEYLFCHAK